MFFFFSKVFLCVSFHFILFFHTFVFFITGTNGQRPRYPQCEPGYRGAHGLRRREWHRHPTRMFRQARAARGYRANVREVEGGREGENTKSVCSVSRGCLFCFSGITKSFSLCHVTATSVVDGDCVHARSWFPCFRGKRRAVEGDEGAVD